jgi:hypothetical protein
MEPNTDQSSSLFELQVDSISSIHLSSAAKWAKFISIVGFVLCAFMALAAFFAGTMFSSLFRASGMVFTGGGVITVFYLLFAFLFFLPNLFLFNYSNKMQQALNGNDQNSLVSSFVQLKLYFRFIGIIMIVVITLYVLVFLVAMMGAMMR